MSGPLVFGLSGTAVVALAAFLHFIVVHPDRSRYVGEGMTYGAMRDKGLRRLVIDQGRISLLAFLGASLQLVGLLWQVAGG